MKHHSAYSINFIAIIIVCLGLLLIVIGQNEFEISGIDIDRILVNLGAFLALIGVLNWLYETYTKKILLSEIFETVVGSKNLSDSGIVDYIPDSRDINFREEIENSSSITTVFSYNSRFMDDYDTQINNLLRKGGSADLMFLGPNSKVIDLMKQLGWEEVSMRSHYRKMERFLENVDSICRDKIRIKFFDAIPRYSAVKFDNVLIIIFNTSSNRKQTVPAIRVKSRTPLWDFYCIDIERIKLEHCIDG